jgi:hypothetical protein
MTTARDRRILLAQNKFLGIKSKKKNVLEVNSTDIWTNSCNYVQINLFQKLGNIF